jgi:hypothetical protein
MKRLFYFLGFMAAAWLIGLAFGYEGQAALGAGLGVMFALIVVLWLVLGLARLLGFGRT